MDCLIFQFHIHEAFDLNQWNALECAYRQKQANILYLRIIVFQTDYYYSLWGRRRGSSSHSTLNFDK